MKPYPPRTTRNTLKRSRTNENGQPVEPNPKKPAADKGTPSTNDQVRTNVADDQTPVLTEMNLNPRQLNLAENPKTIDGGVLIIFLQELDGQPNKFYGSRTYSSDQQPSLEFDKSVKLQLPAQVQNNAITYLVKNYQLSVNGLVLEVVEESKNVNKPKMSSILCFTEHSELLKTVAWLKQVFNMGTPDSVLLDAYHLPFKDEKKVCEDLQDFIQKASKNWSTEETFAPFVTICQSSGYGKSRTIKEIATKQYSAFICLRPEGAIGVPHRSPIADTFIRAMDRHNTATRMVFALVNASIKTIFDYQKHKKNAPIDEIAHHLFRSQPWNYFGQDTNKTLLEAYQLFESRVKTIYEESTTIGDLYTMPDEWELYFKQNGTLTIFLDEAASLLDDSKEQSDSPKCIEDNFSSENDNVDVINLKKHQSNRVKSQWISKFRVLRRAAQQLLRKKEVIFVITGIGMPLSEFDPEPEKFTKSMRVTSLVKLNTPFFSFSFIDQLARDYLSEFSRSTANLYKYLIDRNPNNSLFLLGRPLWASLIQAESRDTVSLAAKKLIGASDWTSLKNAKDKLAAALAILSTRTTITPKLTLSATNQLVSKNMATIYAVDRSSFLFRYVSEPILAEASANILKRESTFIEVVKSVNDFLQSASSLDSLGAIGEFVSQILLLKAFDRISDKTSYSKPRTLEEFLKSLVGETNFKKYFYKDSVCLVQEELLKGLVCFTHFIKKVGQDLEYQHSLDHFLARAAAGQFRNNNNGFDLFTVLVLPNNQLTYVLFQIKNTKEEFKAVQELPTAVQAKWFKTTSPELEPQNRRDYLIIVLNLGADNFKGNIIEAIDIPLYDKLGSVKQTSEIQQTVAFSLNGFNRRLYPHLSDEVLTALRNILDVERFESKTLDSKSDFVKQVMVGSYVF